MTLRLRARQGRRVRCRLTLLALALAAHGAVLPAGASAAPTWLAPAGLSSPGEISSIDVAADPQGNVVAVWVRRADTTNSANYVVQAATRPAGGPWSRAEDLSAPGGYAIEPRAHVAVNSAGTAVALWLQVGSGDNPTRTVQARVRPIGGPWGPAETVSPAEVSATQARVALDGQGKAVALWSTGEVIRTATRPPGGVWSPPQDLGTGGESYSVLDPRIGVAADGSAVAVWYRYSGTNATVVARTRTAAGSWSAAQDLSLPVEGAYAEGPDLAVDAKGNAAVVWHSYYVHASTVLGAVRRAGENWSAAELISAPGQYAIDARVEIDAQGNAVAVWHGGSRGSTSGAIQAAVRPPGGSWGERQDLSPTGRVGSPQVGADLDGKRVAAIWELGGRVHAAMRTAAGPWSAKQDLPGDGGAGSSRVALDAQGNGVAGWAKMQGASAVVQAAGYDAAGPTLGRLAVPERGTVNSPLSFSVSPVDVWSPIASTRWDFDGSIAQGESVTHTYTEPGSHEVTVTSTDAVGNSSSAMRTVAVAEPVGGAPSGGGSLVTASPVPLGLGGLQNGIGRDSLGPALALEARRARGFRTCLAAVRPGVRARGTARTRRRALARQRAGRRRCLQLYGRSPGRVTGLTARGLPGNRVALSFVAPSSDGSRPPAARSYQVKQSRRAMTGSRGFARAHTLCGGACRFSVTRVGARVTLTVTGLRPHTTYFYAVAARDNVSGRLGPRSQAVRVKTP